jgi:hypothetical protein
VSPAVVKDVQLVARDDVQPPIMQPQSADLMLMFERLASDPNASVEKIERLMALWERGEARKSEVQFNAAMSEAQREMRPVMADAYNPQTKSKYASYEALDRRLRPIYTAHGFGLSFGTADSPHELHVRVTCLVTHAAGHSRPYHIDMPADGKGAKGGDVMTRTHATGSAVSYGMRYLLKMIFNVAVGDEDDDGNRAAQRPTATVPEGFQAWWDDMASVADEGIAALHVAWNKSKPEFKTHAQKVHNSAWVALKKRAQQVKVS